MGAGPRGNTWTEKRKVGKSSQEEDRSHMPGPSCLEKGRSPQWQAVPFCSSSPWGLEETEGEETERDREMHGGERFLCNICMLCAEETLGARWSRYKVLRPMSLMEVESCLGVDNGHEWVHCWEMDKLGCV